MDGPEKMEQIYENEQKYTTDIKQPKQSAHLKMRKKKDTMGKSAKRTLTVTVKEKIKSMGQRY